MTPLHHAVIHKHANVVKELLEHGADSSLRGFRDALKGTPLDFALQGKNNEIIDIIQKVILKSTCQEMNKTNTA